jgi:hypothetical protein
MPNERQCSTRTATVMSEVKPMYSHIFCRAISRSGTAVTIAQLALGAALPSAA